MATWVLLFEPFKMLADMLVLSMEELGFKVDIGDSAGEGLELTSARRYACVFINLDQNSNAWHSRGLMFANKASMLGLPVVMIPDNTAAQEIIRAEGWLQVKKPLKLDDLKNVIEKATFARDSAAGTA